ncbi:MAG: hypothetical protein K2J20_02355 [Bacilli bacterium]|nr:hypothetical protein [Bacilli bacterium]
MDDVNFVTYEEVVETFISKIFPQIRTEYETPKFNIIFSEDAFSYFNEIMASDHKDGKYSTIGIKPEDISLLREFSEDVPTIYVKDYKLFFRYLTDIINELLKLVKEYRISIILIHSFYSNVLRKIWLRMGITDFNNVECFLERQLAFVRNREFDSFKTIADLGYFENFNIWVRTLVNEMYDESTRAMEFALRCEEGIHTLPQIFYDIAEENGEAVCYIYAIQNKDKVNRISKIERRLYKLNSGIQNFNVHPNQVFALIKFIELLESRGITRVKVPIRQAFNHRYHELLSIKFKNKLDSWTKDKWDSVKLLSAEGQKKALDEYEHDKLNYKHFVGKEEDIERRKTEKLFDIFMRVMEHLPFLDLINDLDNNDGSLIFKLNMRNVSSARK